MSRFPGLPLMLLATLALARTSAASPPTHAITDASAARIAAYERAFNAAHALTPAFARQTGLACSACHTHYPELTAMGRAFKLNGYVYRRSDSLQGRNPEGQQNMLLNLVTPLSFMVQTSVTSTSAAPPGAQKNTTFFPDQLSLFTGGEITPHVGGFLQVTFDPQSGQLGMDNADFRYANHGTILHQHTIFGVSLNNSPTVQDVWNSTPAWGFPYGSSSAAPTPAASTLIDGNLGQQVAGLTTYAMWNDRVYLEVGGYVAAPVGISRPLDATASGVVKGFAPYWRLALPMTLGRHYLSLGTYGIAAQLYPSGTSGPTNDFTDVAVDLSYLVPFGANSFTTDATWIHESQRWNAGGAANLDNSLSTFRFDAMYHIGHQYALTVAPFTTTGTSDVQLYAPGSMSGSQSGSPNSSGIIGELDIMPWQNLRLQLQYTAYSKFNGGSSNYDGSGRNAADNNTLYTLIWLLF